nr:hypothetical protein [Tanacetum cinerariifolium]
MENIILELVKICQQKELYCMHDNVDDLIKSALNSKLLLINLNSQCLDKEKQEVKNVMEQPAELTPILSTKEPDYSPSMAYEIPNTTPKTESDEIIKSGVKELVPILSENEVTSEDKRERDVPVYENSPISDDHSEIFSDSNNDDDISSDDDAFEDIEYVKASLPDPEIINIVLREKLLSINHLIANIESLNDNPAPDYVLNSSVSFPISKESDNSLSDNFSPEFETFCDHTKETRSGSTTTHADDSLPEYDLFFFEIEPDQERLINDISDDSTNDPLLEEADLFLAFDNSIPPDAEFDFEPDTGEEIPVVMNDIDKLECLDPRDEFDDDDYSSFMFVIYSKVFSFLLFAESEDTIFDPDWKDVEVPVSKGSPITTTARIRETYNNISSQQVATRNRGKAIVNSQQPIYDQEPSMVNEDDETSKDKEIDKLMA